MIMSRDLRRLRRNLASMPALERQVFDRARYRGLDYRAIAAELDIPVAEVERRMASAMRHLVGDAD
jgi:DNA-directed RNA polymerase specialized sigma24 family protein